MRTPQRLQVFVLRSFSGGPKESFITIDPTGDVQSHASDKAGVTCLLQESFGLLSSLFKTTILGSHSYLQTRKKDPGTWPAREAKSKSQKGRHTSKGKKPPPS